ncbi:MAG: hypothetical protein L0H74_13605 [Brachybacterium sp.]|nr:hypothetical protein [Brachybacterium sp.]
MTVVSTILARTNRRATAAAVTLTLTAGGLVAASLLTPSFGDQHGCSSRSTTVGVGYPDGDREQYGQANNRGCSGTGKLEVKLMEHKTWAPDDEVSQSTWNFTAFGSYTRSTWGCDPDDGEFYGEQNLWGNGKKKSSRRAMENCQLK